MDQDRNNSSVTEQHTALQETEVQSQTAPVAEAQQAVAPSSGGTKSLMIAVIVLAILTVAVFIFLLLFPQNQGSLSIVPSSDNQTNISFPTSTPVLNQEEQEVENIAVEDVEPDIKSV